MIILGVAGGYKYQNQKMGYGSKFYNHDSAAALLINGEVVAAVEEERPSRIKHSNNFAEQSVKTVLKEAGVSLSDVDEVWYAGIDSYRNIFDKKDALRFRHKYIPFRERLSEILERASGYKIDTNKINFCHHQYAHALASYVHSGLDDNLVIVLDGYGDHSSGMIFHAKGNEFHRKAYFDPGESLGRFYASSINLIGYEMFDEYKVMGLAPYGDPEVYDYIFDALCTLLPEGRFKIDWEGYQILTESFRTGSEKFGQPEKDFAAALQVALEKIMMHMVSHFKEATGAKNLSLGGGVALNCAVNGQILKSGLFDEIFVHPASHDAGGAVGAALWGRHFGGNFEDTKVYEHYSNENSKVPLSHAYLGRSLGNTDHIIDEISKWTDFLDFSKSADIYKDTAKLIAEDSVIGWVQGRSEFGPRALGNRSILADPRPAKNKDRINAMIKMREGYRPFAPSILEEKVGDYYYLPTNQTRFEYMTFVLDTHVDKREELGAVTHVDGSARVQTVSKETNLKYWQLISEFEKITGTPILLNTSFNNNVEPIVDSIEDAIVCFLTTKLNYLVIDDYLISKKDIMKEFSKLCLHKLKHVVIEQRDGQHYAYFNQEHEKTCEISRELFLLLFNADGKKSIASLMTEMGYLDSQQEHLEQLFELWCKRLIRLAPGSD